MQRATLEEAQRQGDSQELAKTKQRHDTKKTKSLVPIWGYPHFTFQL